MPKKLIALSIAAALVTGLLVNWGLEVRSQTEKDSRASVAAVGSDSPAPAASRPQNLVSGAGDRAFSQRVRTNAYWALPFDNRVPGVEAVRLVDSLDEWLANLPPTDRLAAEQFVGRNGVAFHFESREQQAWLLDRGFPALEEFLAYQKLPEADRRACMHGGGQVCRNEKLAYLAADALLAEAEALTSSAPAGGAGLDGSAEADQVLEEKLMAARSSINVARGSKSMLYRMHLLARLNELDRGIHTAAQAAEFESASARAIARFCGDSRVAVDGDTQSNAAATTLQVIGAAVSVPESTCGIRRGSPWFMPQAPKSGHLAARN